MEFTTLHRAANNVLVSTRFLARALSAVDPEDFGPSLSQGFEGTPRATSELAREIAASVMPDAERLERAAEALAVLASSIDEPRSPGYDPLIRAAAKAREILETGKDG